MIIWIITALLIGLIIGMKIDSESEQNYRDIIEGYEEIIKLYDDCIEGLHEFHKEDIKHYKDALDDTLKENIHLKRKLKSYEQKLIK